jgi:hypothetical protein
MMDEVPEPVAPQPTTPRDVDGDDKQSASPSLLFRCVCTSLERLSIIPYDGKAPGRRRRRHRRRRGTDRKTSGNPTNNFFINFVIFLRKYDKFKLCNIFCNISAKFVIL